MSAQTARARRIVAELLEGKPTTPEAETARGVAAVGVLLLDHLERIEGELETLRELAVERHR